MKVAWLVSNYPNKENPMAGSFHLRMAEAIAKKGVSITVFALTPYAPFPLNVISTKWKKYKRYPAVENKGGVTIIRPRYFTIPRHRNLTGLEASMFLALKKELLSFDPDIIDAHYAYPFGMLARKIKSNFDIPYVLSLHGSDVNVDPFASNKGMTRFKQAVEAANTVKVVSDSLNKKTKDLTGRTSEVIDIGLDLQSLSTLQAPAGGLRKKYNITPDAKIVLYAGALVQSKGVDQLLEAAKKEGSDQLKFIFIGDGPLFKEIPESKHIFKTGKVSPDTVIKYMFESDVFILPSLGEGMPTVLVEAGAAGVPIIATEVGGIPDFLGQGKRGWLIKNNQSETIRQTINHILKNPEEAQQKTVLLKNYIADKFDVNKNAERVINVYHAALN